MRYARSGMAEPNVITRARFKSLLGLKERSGRLALGLQLLEGPRLVREAISAGRVSEVFVAGGRHRAREAVGARYAAVLRRLMAE